MAFKAIWQVTHWAGRLVGALKRRVGLHFASAIHRATLAEVGTGSRFQAGVRFANPRIVRVGNDCYFWRGFHASAEIGDAALVIGNQVQINQGVHLDTTGGLTIGARTLLSQEAVLYTHDHGLDPRAMPRQMPKTVGADVWIGARALVLPQCRSIGAGAIVGAGAVVTRDVPAGAIAAGNPAVIIGQKDIIAQVAA